MTFVIHVDQSFVREEIAFSVVDVSGSENPWSGLPLADARPRRWEALLDTLRDTERPTIVYTMSKPEADRLAAEIPPEFGTRLAYHAGLDDQRRRFVETEFLDGRCDIIIATNAFGMGVDKADVHSVIHWSVPSSPEALYQEAGRAARGSGERARAVLLFHPEDIHQAYWLLRRDVPNRHEISRLDTALGELAGHQQRNVVVVADSDLARLAALRQNVGLHVALAHLERAGLIRELGRHADTRSVSLGVSQPRDLTDLEAAIVRLVEESGPGTMLAAHELVGLADTDDPRAITFAIDGLVRRGILRYERSVSIRLLTDESTDALKGLKDEANRIWKALRAHHREHGSSRYCRTLHRDSGNISLVHATVELLAAFGIAMVSRNEGAPDALAARLSVKANPQQLADTFASAASLIDAVRSIDQQKPIPMDALIDSTGLDRDGITSGLTLLHLAGLASVDLRSWQLDRSAQPRGDRSVGVVRTIELLDVKDRDTALDHARQAAADRARIDRLRLEALRRYAAIAQPEGDDDDGDAHQQYLERYLTEPDFLEEMAADAASDLLAGLTADQRAVVEHPAQPSMVVIAGPGTGKTRTIVTRIAHRARTGLALPERVLAVAFAKAAAGEMTARLAQLGVPGASVRTLDSLAWRILRENWATLGFEGMPTLVRTPTSLSLIRRISHDINAGAVLEEIDLLKARREPLVDDVHRQYQAMLADSNYVDFGDVKALACRLLERDDRTATPYLDAYDEVYVDEFQDLSPLQIHLATLISRRASLTVVGDPRQAIFEWNGASPQSLLDLRDAANATFALADNFRSTVQILDAAHSTISRVLPKLERVTSPSRRTGPPVSQTRFEDSGAMFDHVARTVQAWLDHGIPDSEIAVLAPTKDLVDEAARRLRKAKILTRQVGLVRVAETFAFEVAHRHLGAAAATVQDLAVPSHANADDVEERSAAENATEEDTDLADDPSDIVSLLDRIRATDAVDTALRGTSDRERDANHSDWSRLRARVVEERTAGAADLGTALAAIRSDHDDGPDSAAGVTVSTMTSSKGLEWDAVAVTGLGSREMRDSSANEEKARLAYVAMTRARIHLDLSWTGRPTTWLPKGPKRRGSSSDRSATGNDR